MKRLFVVGVILIGLGLVALTVCLVHFVPAYILAQHTFPDDTTWQPMINWLFPIICSGLCVILGIGVIFIFKPEYRKKE